MQAELSIIESQLNDWGRIPICKAHNYPLPEVAKRKPEEIEQMKIRREEIKNELGIQDAGVAPSS
ncbi:MAG: hypothetical protein K0S29_917 [Gammaproteobacteria bacterium]|nr:hypothetical protein [Gammaproteobacteria bacterium]